MRGKNKVWTDVISRPARLLVQGLTLAGVVTGTVAFASFDKSVDLVVDGQHQKVHAFGDTVGDVLRSEGLRVGGHDIVSPAPSATPNSPSAGSQTKRSSFSCRTRPISVKAAVRR